MLFPGVPASSLIRCNHGQSRNWNALPRSSIKVWDWNCQMENGQSYCMLAMPAIIKLGRMSIRRFHISHGLEERCVSLILRFGIYQVSVLASARLFLVVAPTLYKCADLPRARGIFDGGYLCSEVLRHFGWITPFRTPIMDINCARATS